MDSSKSIEECSSSESGWTRYIASSPDLNNDDDDDDEGDEDSSTGHRQKEGYKKDVDSDDSMASDASSGPSTQYGGGRGLGHAIARTKDARKYVGKKHSQQEEKKNKQHEKKKAAADKDKPGNRANSGGRSRKA